MFRRAYRVSVCATLCAIAVAVLSSTRVAQAASVDIIQLKSGSTLEGTIVEETDKHIQLDVSRGSVWIPIEDVAMIRRAQKPTPLSLERLRRLAEEIQRSTQSEPDEPGQSPEADAKGAEVKSDPRVPRLIAALSSDDQAERDSAKSELAAIGGPAIPGLTDALGLQSIYARTAAAELLGQLSARQSVKEMLVALRSAIPDKNKVRPWQREFVKQLSAALSRVTAQRFDIKERGFNQAVVVEKFVEWWDGKGTPDKDGVPPPGACVTWDTPQVGEPEIAEDAPDRAAQLWEARRVGTRSVSYRAPKSFVDGISGD
jgi:hypothetical protein